MDSFNLFSKKKENNMEDLIEVWMLDAYEILMRDKIKAKFEDIDYNLLFKYMIKHFEFLEEYEKCSDLSTLQKEFKKI